jgi:predicted metalloprotease with PDZ domain
MSIPRKNALLSLIGLFLLVSCSVAVGADRVHYVVSLANPETHLVQVTIEIPPGPGERELQLPVWNALYQVRDFSQYMNWIRAEDLSGRALPLSQLNKSRWKVQDAEHGARVDYEMFANDPGPYGAELNAQHAFFNLAEILCYIEGERKDALEVEFHDVPPGWKIATSLAQQGRTFSASNYDRLVDSPVEISAFDESDFDGECGRYRVVVDADGGEGILKKILSPIQRIVSSETSWMDDCPFQTYLFIYHFSNSSGYGGMEHSYGTAISLPEKDLTENFGLVTGVTAHEFFHLWNVKRIRPQSLEPVDYTKENYTRALWFSEGVDSTVAGYIQLRAGLMDEKRYLAHLGEEITDLEDRPAHLTQSAEQSSVDAWLENYPYYNLPNRSISYYNKGELLGVVIDLKMRDATDDRASLQNLFRWMNAHYAKQGKFFPDSVGVREAAETLTRADFGEFFEKYVSGFEEIPWDNFFGRVGLRVTSTEVIVADPGFEAQRNFDKLPTVVQVELGSQAERGGLKAGDVIIEINGQRAGRDFQRTLGELGAGTTLRLRISRDGVQHDLQWTLGSRNQKVFRLQDVEGITPQQKSRRAAWLFGNAAAAAAASPSPASTK